jgi:alkylation response protein AidB-like acyl-CoA dehydrogenase
MNFSFSEQDNQLFQDMESALIKEKNILEPGALQTKENIKTALLTLQKNLFPLGYLNNPMDGMVSCLERMRIFARHQPSLFLGVEYSFRLFNEMIVRATDDQHRQALCKGLNIAEFPDKAVIGSIAICEDFVETDTGSSSLTAKISDKKIVLSGHKECVINAGIADWIAISESIDGKKTLFFVPSKADGLVIAPLSNDRIFPELVKANIQFNNCKIDPNQIIPSVQDDLLSHIKFYENLAYIACSLAMMDQCIEEAKNFATAHQSENKPMFVHQAVGFSVAEMVTLKQTAELLAFRSAWALETNDSEKQVLNQCAKVFCTETAEKIASKSMDILGGQVLKNNCSAEQSLQNSKFAQLAGTSTHIARVSIGDMVMK